MSFLTINASAPAMGSLLTAYFLKNNQAIEIKIGSDNSLKLNSSGIILDSDASICRFLARSHSQMKYYGTTFLESVAIENWITFSIGPLSCSLKFLQSLEYLDQALYSISFLVGHQITIADFFVWGTLFCNQCWLKILENNNDYKNIIRWFHHIKSYIEVNNALNILQEYSDSKYISTKKVKSQDAGKFIDLPGAKKNEVVVRFPPEASGYLHIGHAKAALLNQYYKDYFGGKLIMRFDDTNPVKEKLNFEKVILEDLKLLKIHPDKFSYTSDYFDLLLELCEKLIKEGKAYVDDTDPEIMKQEREKRKVSKSRNNTLHDNLNLWKQMLEGTEYGQKCCVRAKIDMENDNGCLRDPTIYRCKGESHPRTGNKYKVYPTYDFACPIVDSVEGVTHALRTMEYHDRDEQYYWFIAALKLRKPIIWEYSRLNMMNTVLSKRKLSWFVEEKIVDSWEDPRLPTVRGLIRRGLTVEGLKQFIIAQGSSRSVVQMEWDKIWAFNKKVIDPVASRYTAIRRDKTVIVNVKNAKEELLTINKHPKNLSAGTRKIPIGSKLLIELNDALQLREGENATFINWGNLKINKIYRNGCNSITSIDAETNLNDLDFKKTLKLTWLTDSKNLTPVEAHFFSDIISKPVLGKDEDFKKYVNYNSKRIIEYLGDEDLKTLVVGDIIQLQRIGFFRCDSTFQSSGCVILIHIPDGSSKIDLFNNEKSITSKKSLEENSVDVEKLENRGSVADSKYMPISHQELEQIAIQWRKGREITENGQTKAILVKKKSHSKKITSKPSNCDGEKNMKNDGKQSKSRLGLEVSKTKNFAEWYSQVITKGELIEYYDVSGCYVLRPWSFALWESIQKFLDEKIKSFGVQNCYFPIFLTKSVLEKEKSHLTDFAPEVAWVTKSGESDLAEHIAIRPTSETVMYPAFSKWIQSYRDLPIKLNQWSNVVRWEFKHPQPFLRTREFLWQEGHTAFATSKEAETEVYQVLDLYSKVYTGLLAVPVIKGWKTPKEKFAGSDYTTTLEAFISGSGRGIQGATSHYLGQNFSKMFDISYEDPETKEKKFVYQNSWGMTTRTIGIMIMVHSDDKGLILPPRVASIQVVIVACGITVNLQEEEKKTLINFCKNLESDFIYSGIRAKFDNRENYSPGWKFNHWELKGVPLRVEIGPNDLKKEEVVAVRRDTGEKINFKVKDINEKLKKLLEDVQENLFQKATNELNNSIIKLKTWNGFCEALDDKKIILAPFCEMESCEDNIKKDSARSLDIEPGAPSMGAKSLCIPFEQPVDISEADQCIHPMCKNKPRRYTLFGRSY